MSLSFPTLLQLLIGTIAGIIIGCIVAAGLTISFMFLCTILYIWHNRYVRHRSVVPVVIDVPKSTNTMTVTTTTADATANSTIPQPYQEARTSLPPVPRDSTLEIAPTPSFKCATKKFSSSFAYAGKAQAPPAPYPGHEKSQSAAYPIRVPPIRYSRHGQAPPHLVLPRAPPAGINMSSYPF